MGTQITKHINVNTILTYSSHPWTPKGGRFPNQRRRLLKKCVASLCVCQSLDRSVSRSVAVSQSVGRAVALAASRSVGWPLGRSVGRLRSVGRSIGRWSVDRCQAGSRALGRLVCHSRGGPEGVCRFSFSDPQLQGISPACAVSLHLGEAYPTPTKSFSRSVNSSLAV